LRPLPIAALTLALVLTTGLAGAATAHEQRSRAVTRAFQRAHPCPSTGRRSGACPGWVKDHVIPLACGGPDSPANLQWLNRAAAKTKDQWETRGCVSHWRFSRRDRRPIGRRKAREPGYAKVGNVTILRGGR
jgi:hypothetical protein